MKKILFIALTAFLSLPAFGQLTYPLISNGTNAASGTNTSSVANVRNTRVATINYRFKMAASATDTSTVYLDGSVDGSTYSLAGLGSFTLAANDTSEVETNVSIDTAGFLTVRARVVNGSASVVQTNIYVTLGTKRGVEPSTPIAIAYGGTAAATAAAARTSLGVVASTAGTATGLTLAGTTTNSGLTASLPVFTGAQKQLASKSIADTKTALGIDSGTCVSAADGTVTNAFAFTFSSAPIVAVTQSGVKNTVTNAVESVTTTNFVLRSGQPSVTNNWIAVGAP